MDKQLCELAVRLGRTGHCHGLEVEFRPTQARDYLRKYDLTKFLPEFRRTAVMTFVPGDRSLYFFTRL